MRKNTVQYSKGRIGKVRVVKDFLPAPDKLVLREKNVKVAPSPSRRSIDFSNKKLDKHRKPN